MSTNCDSADANSLQDKALISVRAQRAAHLRQPSLVLPGRDRRVAPEHQDAVAGMEIVADLRLRRPRLYSSSSRSDLALEAGVRRRQAARDLAGRRRHQLVPETTRAL